MSGGPDRPFWERREYALLLVLLAAVPLLWPTIPPLVDLPGHMGRYRVQLDLASSPHLPRYYAFDWSLIGNLGVDLAIVPLAKLIGLEPAVKLVVLLIPPLTVAGLIAAAREVHGRYEPTVAFALPVAFGYPFTFGFVNFALSMALALLAFALWLRLANRGRFGLRRMLFVPIGVVLWITHTFGWGLLGLLAYGAEVIRRHDAGQRWHAAFAWAVIDCLPLAPPVLLMLVWRAGGAASGRTGRWFDWENKWLWLTKIFADRWRLFDLVTLGIALATVPLAMVLRGVTFARKLVFPALILCAVFILLPRIVFGSAYADMRLLPYALGAAIIAIRFRPTASFRLARAVAVAGLLFYVTRIGGHTISYAEGGQRFDRELAALERLPRGARLLSFVGTRCQRPWGERRLAHLPGLAIVRREAFSNDQWHMAGAQLLRVTYPAGRFKGDPSQLVVPRKCRGESWLPIDRALTMLPRDRFDYLWLIDPPPYDPRLLAGMRPLWRSGTSVLLRIER